MSNTHGEVKSVSTRSTSPSFSSVFGDSSPSKFTIHDQRRRFDDFQIPRARQAINEWSSILPITEICILHVILFLSLMILIQIALLSISGSYSFRSADLHMSSYILLLFIGSEKALRRLGEGEMFIQFMVLACHLRWLLRHSYKFTLCHMISRCFSDLYWTYFTRLIWWHVLSKAFF